MTLFSCLLFLVMMSAIFLCLDGILVHQGENKAKSASIGAGEHLLANYNEPLARQYHLYFLDPKMEGNMESRAKQYLNQIFAPEGTLFLKSRPLLKLDLKEVHIKSFGTMQEQQCLYFRHQIREYMKYRLAGEALTKAIGQSVEQMDQKSQSARDIKQSLDQTEESSQTENSPQEEISSQTEHSVSSTGTSTPLEQEEKQEVPPNAQKEDPRKIIHQIVKSGVLGFVTDGKPVSSKKVLPGNLPSGSQKEKNDNFTSNPFSALSSMKTLLADLDGQEALEKLEEDGFLLAYADENYNSYLKTGIENTVLQYEKEYLLGGQASDKENLQYTLNRLILLRFTLDFLYAIQDSELNRQALTLALALSGPAGVAPAAEAVKYMILGAVSFGEALVDAKALLAGKKISLLKTKGSWKVSVKGALGIYEEGGEEKGLSYDEYLALLLAVQTKKNRLCLRMQDLMQMNILQKESGFSIKKCMFGFEMDSQVQASTWFLHKSFTFQHHRVFSY